MAAKPEWLLPPDESESSWLPPVVVYSERDLCVGDRLRCKDGTQTGRPGDAEITDIQLNPRDNGDSRLFTLKTFCFQNEARRISFRELQEFWDIEHVARGQASD